MPYPVPRSEHSGERVAGARRHRLRLGVAALLLVALIGAAAAWYRGRVPEPPAIAMIGIDPAIVAVVAQARAAVLRTPRSGSAWGRLGMVLAAHEFSAEANGCFVQAERLEPTQPRWPYYQGVALALGDPDAALPKLLRAVQLCDAVPDTPRLRLAELYLAQGNLADAAEQYRRLLEHQPEHPRAHLGLARIAYRQGDLEMCRQHLDPACTAPSTQKAAFSLRAEVQQRRGDAAAADATRRQAYRLPDDPAWPDPFVEEVAQLRTGKQAALERAEKRLRQGRSAEAIALLQEIVRDYPESDWGWYLLGKAYCRQHAWRAAEPALRRAAELAPAAAEIQFQYGVTLFQLQELAAATACFRKATQLKPDDDAALYDLGLCLQRQGDLAGALTAFRAALRCEPHQTEARRAMGNLLFSGLAWPG